MSQPIPDPIAALRAALDALPAKPSAHELRVFALACDHASLHARADALALEIAELEEQGKPKP